MHAILVIQFPPISIDLFNARRSYKVGFSGGDKRLLSELKELLKTGRKNVKVENGENLGLEIKSRIFMEL